MSQANPRQNALTVALATLSIPQDFQLHAWTENAFPAIQSLSDQQGWPTPNMRPEEALQAWQNSWPALVVSHHDTIVGFVRGLTDGTISMYIAELLIASSYRGLGLGRLLLDACHALYPHTRLDLISTDEANAFYKSRGFRLVGDGLRKSYH